LEPLPSLRELFDLSGKVAIVTGGSRGIGLEIAEGLGEAGARVVITARREPDLVSAAAHLDDMGIQNLTFQGSVAEPAAVAELVQASVDRFARIDILVNNAGVSWGAPTLEMPLDRWQYVLDTNLTGAWLVSQAVARQMVAQGQGGRIINIASTAGLQGGRPSKLAVVGYHASKAGLVGLTRTLATHLAEHNILVNAICPSFFPTRLSRPVLERVGQEAGRDVPLGRIGRPGELKGVAVFLAAPASSFITGQALAVDGGSTAW
jgi:NAD(P)-dependent dehydrogenase (short-subunit alcohol dehydrogenase family)